MQITTTFNIGDVLKGFEGYKHNAVFKPCPECKGTFVRNGKKCLVCNPDGLVCTSYSKEPVTTNAIIHSISVDIVDGVADTRYYISSGSPDIFLYTTCIYEKELITHLEGS